MTGHRRVVIIGGGYSGAASAMTLARQAGAPLEISVVEPRAQLGAGTAYATAEPAHRLNVQDSLMVVHADAIDDFSRWLTDTGVRAADRDGHGADGQFYARRSDFARYMGEQVARFTADNASGSAIVHVRDRAVGLAATATGAEVTLAGGARLDAELVVVALGNEAPAVPGGLPAPVLAHPGYLADPWDNAALARVPADARVLLIGSGLTAADVIASLTAHGHRGPVLAVSRRGLLPQGQGQFPGVEELLRRISQPVPILVQQHGMPKRVAEVLAWVRSDVAAAAARGEPWHDAVDAVRDAANSIWPALTLAERRRYFRHLKPFYDSHRFRLAPQVEAVLQGEMARGRLALRAARIVAAEARGDRLQVALRPRHGTATESEPADVVVNCTGPNPDPARSGSTLLRDAIDRGLLATDPSGVGLAVDGGSQTLRRDGGANARILALGPLTKGRFAEVVAVPQITVHLQALAARLRTDGLL